MPLHIGIVACSAEGAALCYRTVCIEGAYVLGRHDHPEVSMHTHSLADYMKCVDRGDWVGVAELMLSSAHKLAAIGADFLICPDNTGFRRLGLTGTRSLVESEIYPDSLEVRGLECVRANATEREAINRIIFEELVNGVFTLEAVTYFQRVIERMKREGCDAVVLGCTEIPLIMSDANSPLPTLDSTRLLARAALHRAVEGVAS
jgi:aspartate racemase